MTETNIPMLISARRLAGLLLLAGTICVPASAAAQDRLCDPGDEDCRSVLLNYIRNEQAGIDVAFWFMEDQRYTTALIERHRAGVPVRVLIDTRANEHYPLNPTRLAELANAGIPMRRRLTNYILHWKMMLFHGQGVVEFSGANFSADAWRPATSTPYENYTDEAIYFTDDSAIVDSFRTKFDDHWVDTSGWTNYANVTAPLVRQYPVYPKDPSLNFPPGESFRSRSVSHYKAEKQKIDVIMFRITDRQHTDNILAAVARGVQVRLITEPKQYRDVTRIWHSWNVDRLYMGGVQIKHRQHAGLNHQKSVILYSQRMGIFGSSNWTSPSNNGQVEHNIFTTKPYIFNWLVTQFERKWNNTGGIVENVDFVPLPPDTPKTPSPAAGATGVKTTLTLRWYGGPWAHLYDVLLDTNPNPTTPIAQNVELGPSETSTTMQSLAVPFTLTPGTTYYWRVVGRTMALQQRVSPVWSFTTEGTTPPPPPPPPPGEGDIVLYAGEAAAAGGWRRETDSSAAGGAKMRHPDAGAAKLTTALANPTNYFEMTFPAEAGKAYRLWVRGRADSNNGLNDSVFVQFSGSVSSTGSSMWRIGTTSFTEVNIEDCSGCGLSNWGWQDNGWGVNVMGPLVYFNSTGTHTIRVQTREDGLAIDQIVLSPGTYLNGSPGTLKNDTTILPKSAGGAGSTTTPPPPPPGSGLNEIVLHASSATAVGAWRIENDTTAAGSMRARHPDAGAAKLSSPAASPSSYVELTFNADAGKAYRLWIRGKADSNHWANDSVFVQFSGSVTASGSSTWRIGTTSATEVNLEDCSGCGIANWGWQDNGWGVNVLGPLVYFGASGQQTIRIQTREDGFSIDQVVLSAAQYLNAAPGALKNDSTILAKTP